MRSPAAGWAPPRPSGAAAGIGALLLRVSMTAALLLAAAGVLAGIGGYVALPESRS
ncbi:hypothetical protein [Streptomyces sp. Ag109_G2-15]|uniref:hypothetical protein n=1 Tax=Streptomyces sp. Ag109_G2-15 TaxID=1938850 RepID=UPI0015CF0DC4|nr:hypothetical protein [Streptomyces sp. Ag109_G2-15]